jgi:hypothetical protein
VGIEVSGLKEVKAALKSLSDELPRELVKISKRAAEIVAPEAQSRAPVLSGKLRGTIKAAATQAGAFVKLSGAYAGPIVGGWPAHNIKPNPFIWRALDSKTDEVVQEYNDGIADLIERFL